MDLFDIGRGAALGLAVAAPIGPTAVLCIQRTLAGGIGPGLATGYGAATAHVVYASAAAAGLAMLPDAAMHWSVALQVGCAAFLVRLAVLSFRRAPRLTGMPGRRPRTTMAYATGLAWTLGNPMTLLGFATLTAGIIGQEAHPWADVPAVAAGVLLGSAGWWTVLATIVAVARHRLNDRALYAANVVTGVMLGAFALVVAANALRSVC